MNELLGALQAAILRGVVVRDISVTPAGYIRISWSTRRVPKIRHTRFAATLESALEQLIQFTEPTPVAPEVRS